MKRSIINRVLSEETLKNVNNDLRFLVDKVINSGFEYDLQIRDNFLSLYYRGNSIGKISYLKTEYLYKIEINHKFISDKIKARFKPQKNKDDCLVFHLSRKQLHSLFSSANLLSMAQRVKKVNFKEELTFEQMLITDNVNRPDFIIIDRQIADHLDRNRVDLLALIRKKSNKYQFCVIEVKLGNNPYLKGEVARQLRRYVSKIKAKGNFKAYKECYELNFQQKWEIGLFDEQPQFKKINIVDGVFGMVVAVGYSAIAEKSIRELKQQYPDIKVLLLKHTIDFSKAI